VTRYVLDADAWLILRGLECGGSKLIDVLLNARPPTPPALVTEFVARHELNSIQPEIVAAAKSGKMELRYVRAADPKFKQLRQSGVHKGEAETIAWLVSLRREERRGLLYVARDQGAVNCAKAEGLEVTDIFGVVVDLLALGDLAEDEVAITLSVWNDKTQQRGRPKDWEGFEATLARRRQRGAPYL
jgi:predicted nucleic acid-binding protein